MSSKAFVLGCVLGLGAGGAAADDFGGHLRLSGVLFDNFFQAPQGMPQEDVPAANVEAGLRRDFGRSIRAYGDVDYTTYRDYSSSHGVTAGLNRQPSPHGFELQGQLMWGRPSREVRDEFDRADSVGVSASYAYRVGVFEPMLLADARHETYDLSDEKANDVYNLGAALRLRGLGRVSPEVGLRVGRRDVLDDNEDLDQREIYLRLRWAPARPTYLSLRVRRRFREYSIADVRAGNFAREDTRTQLVAAADLFQTSRLGLNLYYSVEDSDSTHPRGDFLTQMGAAGLVLRF